MRIYIFFLISILGSCFLNAQNSNSEIWLFKMDSKKGTHSFAKPLNISNNPSYDNQPCFFNEDKNILFSSQRDSTKQTDIYNFSMKENKISRLTNTKESEYSPQLHPDNKKFTCVVVEQDSTQRIWQYNLEGKNPTLYTPKTDSIGYYAFLNSDSLIYYKLTDPHSLRVLSLSTGKDQWIGDHPSRSVRALNSHEFYYSTADSKKQYIRRYDSRKLKSEIVAECELENLDFNWDNEFGLLKSEGSKILRYDFERKVWIDFFDFSVFGIKKITRFVFSKNKKYFALVDNQ